MTVKDIALRNLRRRKAKAAFVFLGLLIGVSAVVAFVSLIDALTQDIRHKLETYGANILIVPKTENLSLTYGGLSLGGISFEMEEIYEADLKKVHSIKNARNIAALGPVLLGTIEVEGHRALLAGVDFEKTRVFRPWWKMRGEIPADNAVLVGASAAQVLGLRPGSHIKVNGRKFSVSGLLEPSGSQDDQMVFTRLSVAQSVLGKEGRVSMAEVAALCSDCPVEEMVKQISQVLPGANVMAIKQVVKGRMETLGHFRKIAYGLSIVVVLVGGLVVLVTMMGSVRERTGEIGIFRAIGFRRSHIIRIVLFEALIVSALAGILGYFMGLATTKILLPLFSESHGVSVPWDPTLAGGAFGLSVLLGLVSSIYPAILAARLDPNEALRAL
jgi:putative ABC transport system permease protein